MSADINRLKSTFDSRSNQNLLAMNDAKAAGNQELYNDLLNKQIKLENTWSKLTGGSSSLGKIRLEGVEDFGTTSLTESSKDLFGEFRNNISIRENIAKNLSDDIKKDIIDVLPRKDRETSVIKALEAITDPDLIKQDKAVKQLMKKLMTAKERGFMSAELIQDIAKLPVSVLATIDMPILQVLFATQFDPKNQMALNVTLPAMFTDEAARFLNLYSKSGGKVSKFMKLAARAGVPINIAKKLFPLISKGGTIGTVAGPLLELGRQAYLEKERRDQLPDLARQFKLPKEEIEKGYSSYVRGSLPETLAGQGLDYLEVPESPGLEGMKRGIQEFASILNLAKNPYAQNYEAPNPMELERLYQRQGFKDGGMSRRKFLKLLSLIPAGVAGLASLRMGPAKTKKVVETVKNVPTYFYKLVDKIKDVGEDVTKRFATDDLENVFNYRTSDADYELYENVATGDKRIKIIKGDPDAPGYKEQELTLTKGQADENVPFVPDEYDEYTVRSDFDGKMKDVDEGLDDIDDLIDELGPENISVKELQDMGYDVDRLGPVTKKKLGIK